MADYVIKVDYADLNTAATAFSSNATKVRNLTNKMLATIKEAGGTWTGEASQAYLGQFAKLDDDMKKMYDMIQEHVSDLKEMAKNYKKAEDDNKSLSSKLSDNVI